MRSNACKDILNSQKSAFRPSSNLRTTVLGRQKTVCSIHILRLLVEAGADINQRGPTGSCLHEAALYGKTDVVKYLVEVLTVAIFPIISIPSKVSYL